MEDRNQGRLWHIHAIWQDGQALFLNGATFTTDRRVASRVTHDEAIHFIKVQEKTRHILAWGMTLAD